MSERGARDRSGAMKPSVPWTATTPQSITSTAPNSPTITFCGLRSRCTTSFAHATDVVHRDHLADAREDAQRIGHAALLAQPAVQPRAAHELHRVVEASVRQRAGIVDGNDSGMLEAGDDARLRAAVVVDDLHGHVALQRLIAHFVHDAHPAAPQLAG